MCTVGLTVELKLRFQIPSMKKGPNSALGSLRSKRSRTKRTKFEPQFRSPRTETLATQAMRLAPRGTVLQAHNQLLGVKMSDKSKVGSVRFYSRFHVVAGRNLT